MPKCCPVPVLAPGTALRAPTPKNDADGVDDVDHDCMYAAERRGRLAAGPRVWNELAARCSPVALGGWVGSVRPTP